MKIYILPTMEKMKKYCLFSAAAFLALSGLLAVLPPDQASKLEPISQGPADEKKIALTCNIFWGEQYLPAMLKALEENDVKITFFVGGTWAKGNPDILKEIAAKGHEIANHSYNHPHPNALSKEKNQEQILKTEEIIEGITGVKTTLYAPPYGEYNDTVLKAAEELHYPTIMWSIDTVDWKRPPAEVIKGRVLKKAHNGAFVLMHPTEQTAKALPEIIAALKKDGYTLTTISDIIKKQ